MFDQDDRYIGQNVKKIRKRRGISQQLLADRVGVSRSCIAMYESGDRAIESRKVLYALALGLNVAIEDLTGHHEDRLNPADAEFHSAVPHIEAALMAQGTVDDERLIKPLPELVLGARHTLKLRAECDDSALASMLPWVISGLYWYTESKSDEERRQAWEALSIAAFVTSRVTKVRGYSALSWIASRAASDAATYVGSTDAIAAAEWQKAQVLLGTPGALTAALNTSVKAADELQPYVTTAADVEMYGMLHLNAAMIAAALGKHGAADSHVDEAAETATRMTDGPTWGLIFGTPNVHVWKMGIAIEQADSAKVIELSRQIDPTTIPTNNRRSQFFVELARAQGLERHYQESLYSLLRAEHIAPEKIRSMTSIREQVGLMMRKAKRDLTTGDLGQLAQRVGAIPV